MICFKALLQNVNYRKTNKIIRLIFIASHDKQNIESTLGDA